ncbi:MULTISPECIES: hypothetical protein [unclassified Caulobacter]|jgi:hypothetical protein|uniref:hypothetical protein n=1 Tax=unclassified Caulobacter TaxID=2648921 RepID=UPI000784A663|nr:MULTISPECIES: hypothetical protein [unclassified Caulobacter]AZS21263.1 hypothetical protein CSW63_11745 [Caulobacter sp. FWC26]
MRNGARLWIVLAAVFAGGVARAEIVQKPAMSVSAKDGRFAGYYAALPLDLSTDNEKVALTVKSSGKLGNPTYDLDLNFVQKPDDERVGQRSLALGASWNENEARLRSSMSKLFGFGLLPRANYVRVSMDMNASQSITAQGVAPVARANIRSSLTLDGKPIGSIAVGGGTTGDEGVDLSLTRPFDLPAEFTVSLRGVNNPRESWRLQDARAMVKLVKATW